LWAGDFLLAVCKCIFFAIDVRTCTEKICGVIYSVAVYLHQADPEHKYQSFFLHGVSFVQN